MADVPDQPHPLDPDDLLERIDDWCDNADTGHEYVGRDLLYETWHQVEAQATRIAELEREVESYRLSAAVVDDEQWNAQVKESAELWDAEVEAALRTQLADAHAVIRRYVEGWELDYYDARPDEEFWRHPFGSEDEPMTPGEVAAIAAARATEGDSDE